MKKGVIGLGAKAMDIVIIEDIDFQTLKDLFDDLTERVANGWSRGQETTFIFVYYTGHGVQTNYTYAVLNNPDPRRWRFPLEMHLRTLGTIPGAWVVGVFDCCRENFVLPGRDSGNGDNDIVDMSGYRNTFMSFGCPPNKSVPGISTLAVDYFV